MRRHLHIYRLTVRNSLIRDMSFKLNFLLWMLVEVLWFVGQLAFIEVLYGQVDTIAGWTKWQVVALFGAHQIVAQLFQAFFYVNIANIPELVRTGRLDIILTLPIDPQFAVSTRQISFDCIVNALIGVAIVTFSLYKLSILPTAAQLLLSAAAILLGIGVHYAIMLTLACISFWSIRAQFIHGYFSLFMIGRYPEAIFRGAFRVLFTWILPIIWVANVPAQLLARPGDNPWPGIAALLTGTLIALTLSRLFWKFALTRYSSASS